MCQKNNIWSLTSADHRLIFWHMVPCRTVWRLLGEESEVDEETQLSRRERQIMDVVYALEQASATEVLAAA